MFLRAQITIPLQSNIFYGLKKIIQFIILQTIGPMEVERPRALHLA